MNEKLYQKILRKTLNFLSFRSRSKKEVVDRLKKYLSVENLTEQERSDILQKVTKDLEDQGLINDEHFARLYIEQKLLSNKPIGKALINQFLFKKGISKDVIRNLEQLFTSSIEQAQIEKLLEKKLKNLKAKNTIVAKRKLLGALLRKGFSPSLVYAAVDTKFKLK